MIFKLELSNKIQKKIEKRAMHNELNLEWPEVPNTFIHIFFLNTNKYNVNPIATLSFFCSLKHNISPLNHPPM